MLRWETFFCFCFFSIFAFVYRLWSDRQCFFFYIYSPLKPNEILKNTVDFSYDTIAVEMKTFTYVITGSISWRWKGYSFFNRCGLGLFVYLFGWLGFFFFFFFWGGGGLSWLVCFCLFACFFLWFCFFHNGITRFCLFVCLLVSLLVCLFACFNKDVKTRQLFFINQF